MRLGSDFVHPPLLVGIPELEAHFASKVAKERRPLRNPHHEPRVSQALIQNAKPAGVLLPIIRHGDRLTLLVTRRHRNIRFAGHICFPGGVQDVADKSPQAAAMRESWEEIALAEDRVRVLGLLGDYYTQTGYCITPVVGLIDAPVAFKAHPAEVEQILEIPLAKVFVSQNYHLSSRSAHLSSRGAHLSSRGAHLSSRGAHLSSRGTRLSGRGAGRRHFSFVHEDVRIAGPTVSIMMGLYEEMLRSRGQLS